MKARGSSVNTASSRSYGRGVASHGLGPIGPGLGGFPRLPQLSISSTVTAKSQRLAALDVASATLRNSGNRSASSLERDSTSSSKISSTTKSMYFVECGGLTPGRLHHLPRRDLADTTQLGREGLSQPHLL